MTSGKILYARHGDVLIVKLIGEISDTLGGDPGSSTALHRFAEQVRDMPGVAHVAFDCTDTRYIDSTHLGLLAHLGKCFRERTGAKPPLLATRPEVIELLRGMALHQVFELVEQLDDGAETFAPVPAHAGERGTPTESARTVLAAHKALAELSPNNASAFRDIIELLERELQPPGGD
jgi:anti-anti-sigma factor